MDDQHENTEARPRAKKKRQYEELNDSKRLDTKEQEAVTGGDRGHDTCSWLQRDHREVHDEVHAMHQQRRTYNRPGKGRGNGIVGV